MQGAKRKAAILFTLTLPALGAESCVWVVSGAKLTCAAISTVLKAGPPGPQGIPGPAGAPGPAGPPGASGIATGGPCKAADNAPALFARLPDSTCLPVIATGDAAGTVDPGSGGVAVALSPGIGVTISGTATAQTVNVDSTVVPFLGAANVWSGPNNMSQQIISKAIPYTATGADFGILCDTATAGVALTMTEMLAPWQGLVRWYRNTGTQPCTIAGNGKAIDGAKSLELAARGSVLMQYDGRQWWVIAQR